MAERPRIYCLIAVLIFLMTCCVCAACAVVSPVHQTVNDVKIQNTNALPSNVTVANALKMREKGAFILDVRQEWEWNWFHIPGSTLIPLGQLADRVAELPRDHDILVVCRSGYRSRKGRDILLNAGFTRVTSMDGGVKQWEAAGYPIVGGE